MVDTLHSVASHVELLVHLWNIAAVLALFCSCVGLSDLIPAPGWGMCLVS